MPRKKRKMVWMRCLVTDYGSVLNYKIEGGYVRVPESVASELLATGMYRYEEPPEVRKERKKEKSSSKE